MIIQESIKSHLDSHGVTNKMTKEKMDGTYKRPAALNLDSSDSIANHIVKKTKEMFD